MRVSKYEKRWLGMVVALFMILMYVAFRFQYKFALGAVTALAHDVVIILGLFSIFAWDVVRLGDLYLNLWIYSRHQKRLY